MKHRLYAEARSWQYAKSSAWILGWTIAGIIVGGGFARAFELGITGMALGVFLALWPYL